MVCLAEEAATCAASRATTPGLSLSLAALSKKHCCACASMIVFHTSSASPPMSSVIPPSSLSSIRCSSASAPAACWKRWHARRGPSASERFCTVAE